MTDPELASLVAREIPGAELYRVGNDYAIRQSEGIVRETRFKRPDYEWAIHKHRVTFRSLGTITHSKLIQSTIPAP